MGDYLDANNIYELIFKTSTEGILVCNEEGIITMANNSLLSLFGYQKEELVGEKLEILLPDSLKEKHISHRSKYTNSPSRRKMGTGRDLFGKHKNGNKIPLEISLNHMQMGGKLFVMALITDISLRKEQEQKIQKLNQELESSIHTKTKKLKETQILYQLIAKNFPNGSICILDKNMEITFVEGKENSQRESEIKYELKKKYTDYLEEKKSEEVKAQLQKVFAGSVINFQIKKGEHIYQVDAVPLLYGKSKKIHQVLIVEHNVTKIKKLESKMKESLLREIELNELKTRFISIASHEFRTPLSTILSSVSLIEKYDELGNEDKKKKHFEKIKKSINNLTHMIEDTLTISRIEEKRIFIEKEKVNLRELIQEILNETDGLRSENQFVETEFFGDKIIENDVKILKIIFANLLSNALKYSEDKVSMHIKATKDNLSFTVEDRGIGIPIKDQDKLFERFYRANNVSNIQGTGLGLNIVEGYVSVLNGSISIDSQENIGTIVKVVLPL